MKYPLLSDDGIVRFLRQVRFNPVFRRTATRIPIWSFLKYIGVSRQTAYCIMLRRYHHELHAATREKLSLGADLVARGLYFTRRDRKWMPVLPSSLEIKWPGIYSGASLEMENSRGDPHMGVSQQALPEPVRQRGRSSAVPPLPGGAGQMDAPAIRNPQKRPRRRRICSRLSKRFPYVKFSNPKHWRKQQIAAKAARKLNRLRALASARNAGLGSQAADRS